VLAALLTSAAGGMVLAAGPALAQSDPLPSWNDGRAKQSILDFVTAVTREGSLDFVPMPQRIATFDNDGTLWCEQPMYVQLAFALDQVKALAPQHPDWKTKQPFKAVLDGDRKALAETGERGLVELVMATHANISTGDFERVVTDWISSARHPRFKRPYTDLVYQPMLELLAYLRANGFKTYIVSGGGIEFMRPWTERVYGVPPGAGRGIEYQNAFYAARGYSDIASPSAGEFRRRRTRQAGWHQRTYRAAPDRRIWQFGRRSADAAMDDQGGSRSLPWFDRASHGWRARICL
jgi:hypothetical protein